MKSHTAIASRRSPSSRVALKAVVRPAMRIAPAAAELVWPHFGFLYRLTLWPDVVLERQTSDGWEVVTVTEAVLDSGAVSLDAAAWRRYLAFLPATQRAFVERFRFGRLGALLLAARCPGLLSDVEETPALASFFSAHAELRGSAELRWEELAVVHERGGLFAVLEWLGLPAERGTLEILRNLVDPDVPRRLLGPLRVLLWRPSAALILRRSVELTDQQLARYCHALAA